MLQKLKISDCTAMNNDGSIGSSIGFSRNSIESLWHLDDDIRTTPSMSHNRPNFQVQPTILPSSNQFAAAFYDLIAVKFQNFRENITSMREDLLRTGVDSPKARMIYLLCFASLRFDEIQNISSEAGSSEFAKNILSECWLQKEEYAKTPLEMQRILFAKLLAGSIREAQLDNKKAGDVLLSQFVLLPNNPIFQKFYNDYGIDPFKPWLNPINRLWRFLIYDVLAEKKLDDSLPAIRMESLWECICSFFYLLLKIIVLPFIKLHNLFYDLLKVELKNRIKELVVHIVKDNTSVADPSSMSHFFLRLKGVAHSQLQGLILHAAGLHDPHHEPRVDERMNDGLIRLDNTANLIVERLRNSGNERFV